MFVSVLVLYMLDSMGLQKRSILEDTVAEAAQNQEGLKRGLQWLKTAVTSAASLWPYLKSVLEIGSKQTPEAVKQTPVIPAHQAEWDFDAETSNAEALAQALVPGSFNPFWNWNFDVTTPTDPSMCI